MKNKSKALGSDSLAGNRRYIEDVIFSLCCSGGVDTSLPWLLLSDPLHHIQRNITKKLSFSVFLVCLAAEVP